MGLTNWAMQKAMRKEAVNIANKVYQYYPPEEYNNVYKPVLNGLLKPFFGKELSDYSRELQLHVRKKLTTIEGFCYMVGLDTGRLKGAMIFRCLQFTQIMDNELYKKGYRKQNREDKVELLKTFELAVGNFEPFL